MNYNNDTLRNALAAEYVLGTLRGGARRRFKQIIMTNKAVAAKVWEWEQYINGLGKDLPPVSPDKKVWELIQTRLGFDTAPSNVTPLITKPKKKFSLNTMMIAASFMLAILFTSMQFRDDFVPVSQFAVVNDEALNPLWLIDVADDELIVRPTAKLAQLSNNDYELWIVPANGSAPVSLGVLPQSGQLASTAPSALRSVDFSVLAVSLEPVGGSPTGQPTQVLFTANIIEV